MKKKLVVFGLAEMAKVVHFYFTKDARREVACFTADAAFVKQDSFLGLPVAPFEEIEKLYPPDGFDMFIATGYRNLNMLRAQKCREAREKGYALASYVSSRASVWDDLQVGDNCLILEGCTLQPFVRIGNNVFVWTVCHFGHDVVVGDDCFFSSHVVTCGGVSIGSRCFIGGNSFIRDGVKIGEENIIGAQAVILGDTKKGQVFIAERTGPYRLDSAQFMRFMDISKP